MTIPILYGHGMSPFVRVPLLALYELGMENGVDYELRAVDQHSPEFLANTNPFGKVPAFEIDGFIIFESRATSRFLANKYEKQGTNLLGSTPEERGTIDQWMEVESQSFQPHLTALCMELFFKPTHFKTETNHALVTESIEKLEKCLKVYDAHLSKNKYLAGDFFSMADLFHMPMLAYFLMGTGKESIITSHKHVNAWWEDISSRPAWKKMLETHTFKR